jgi:hypothetical protein
MVGIPNRALLPSLPTYPKPQSLPPSPLRAAFYVEVCACLGYTGLLFEETEI